MSFSSELKLLLSKTEVKNASIAEAVQYDNSYISKWLSGRVIPAERYIEKIALQIAACIVEESSVDSLVTLCEVYNCKESELTSIISERLVGAYYSSEQPIDTMNTYTVSESLIDVVKTIGWNGQTTLATDIFAMEHESRLSLAGIENGHFTNRESTNCYLKMIIDLSTVSDIVYDPIFLVHMLTSYSGWEFNLYSDSCASGKILYADENQSISAMLVDENSCLAVAKQKNASVSKKMRHCINAFCTQEALVVRKIDDLLEGQLYLQSLLASQFNWITGHFTEQLIPEDLYAELCEQFPKEKLLMQKIGQLLRNSTLKAKIMIYRSAFSKLMINGELDFFNHKIELLPEQQMKCLQYIRLLAVKGEIRIVDGGFNSDFQYITDPCIFLTDAIDYIRLENGQYNNNLLYVVDKKLSCIFHDFFHEVWSESSNIVLKEKTKVLELIDTNISQLELLL